VLRFWANDATPPRVRLVSHTLFGTEAVLHAVVTDRQSGFDPSSLSVTVDGHSIDGAKVSGDDVTMRLGKLKPGRHHVRISVADYQELKNSENANASPLPNTRVVHETVVVK
jgi:hypothetical protein